MDLDAPIDRVFAFHGNPRNIPAISPGWQQVEIKQGDVQARVSGEFEIVVRFFGVLSLSWRGVWREVDAPGMLVDEAIRSPFAYWRHRHEFTALDPGRTRMTDHITYAFSGGWLGKWFGETFGRVQFGWMFADRHARTQRWMREHP